MCAVVKLNISSVFLFEQSCSAFKIGTRFSCNKKQCWSPEKVRMVQHEKLTLTNLHLHNFTEDPMKMSHGGTVLRRVWYVDKRKNLLPNYPWPGWIWRTCRASSDWLSRPGLAGTAGDKPLRRVSQNSTPSDRSTNRPLYQGADGNACREGQVCYVTTYYACLLLRDGTGGESAGGFNLFLYSELESRVWSNLIPAEYFILQAFRRSKTLLVTYLR